MTFTPSTSTHSLITHSRAEQLPAARPVVGQSGSAKSPTADHVLRKKPINGGSHRLRCPHCKCMASTRTSLHMTPLTKESIYQCSNPECGHSFVALTEIVRTLSPSAIPDPSVNLPLSTHVRRDLLKAIVELAKDADHKRQYQTQPVNGDLFAGGPPAD